MWSRRKIYNSKILFQIIQNWWISIGLKKLSRSVTNPNIDRLYKLGIKNGAFAGKLVGAGGGGFCYSLLIKKKKSFLNLFKIYYLTFKFENNGSQIIYYKKDINYDS